MDELCQMGEFYYRNLYESWETIHRCIGTATMILKHLNDLVLMPVRNNTECAEAIEVLELVVNGMQYVNSHAVCPTPLFVQGKLTKAKNGELSALEQTHPFLNELHLDEMRAAVRMARLMLDMLESSYDNAEAWAASYEVPHTLGVATHPSWIVNPNRPSWSLSALMERAHEVRVKIAHLRDGDGMGGRYGGDGWIGGSVDPEAEIYRAEQLRPAVERFVSGLLSHTEQSADRLMKLSEIRPGPIQYGHIWDFRRAIYSNRLTAHWGASGGDLKLEWDEMVITTPSKGRWTMREGSPTELEDDVE